MLASEIAATVMENAFDSLKGPVIRITAPDIPVPFSPRLSPNLSAELPGEAGSLGVLSPPHDDLLVKPACPFCGP